MIPAPKHGPAWPSSYIGRRFDYTPEECCAGLAGEIYRGEWDRELPSVRALVDAYRAGDTSVLGRRVSTPIDGDLVVMGDELNPGRHVGVWSGALRMVVHSDDIAELSQATDLGILRAFYPVIEFRRFLEAA